MNNFSKSVLKKIYYHFQELKNVQNGTSNFLELDITSVNNSSFGGLVIQTTDKNDIWIRNYHPYSAYPVDGIEDLITIMKGVFTNTILWVISFKEDEWLETTLTKEEINIETEEGITYQLLSWDGKADKIIKL